MALTFQLLSSATLGSAQSSVVFSNIPQTHTDLILRFTASSSRASTVDLTRIRFNGLSTTVYSDTVIQMAAGGAASSTSTTSNTYNYAPRYSLTAANGTTNFFGASEVYIPSYTTSAFKQFGGTGIVSGMSSTVQYFSIGAQLFRSANPVTEITLTTEVGPNFTAGSQFWLYGVKSA